MFYQMKEEDDPKEAELAPEDGVVAVRRAMRVLEAFGG